MQTQPREIITISCGRTGNQIAHQFWRGVCEEHCIDYSSGTGEFCGAPNGPERDSINVFFDEGRDNTYVPRTVLVDTNLMDLQQLVRESSGLGAMYSPDHVIGCDDGSGNCYAKAFHTEGPDLADQVLDSVRKEIEKCNCLQGVQFCHSICGGTGSGVTGLLAKTLYDFLDKGSRCVLQSFTLLPAPGVSDIVVEHYNACLGLQDLLEYCQQVFCSDNAALTSICQKSLDMQVPRFEALNNIVGLCMAGITSSMRFPGLLDADLRKMHTSLVPFKNAQFLIAGIAPLTSASRLRQTSAFDMTQQMLSKDNITVKCDPLNPGDPREGILKARFLATFACYRGGVSSGEIDYVLSQLQADGSRYDKYFPDWIPNSISHSICRHPHSQLGDSVTFVTNNTAIYEVFDRILAAWDLMFAAKSHLHRFEADGIHQQDMLESRNVVQYISDQYKEYAKWEDKLFTDQFDSSGLRMVNETAVQNDEQLRIAEELRELSGDCYIRPVKTGRA